MKISVISMKVLMESIKSDKIVKGKLRSRAGAAEAEEKGTGTRGGTRRVQRTAVRSTKLLSRRRSFSGVSRAAPFQRMFSKTVSAIR